MTVQDLGVAAANVQPVVIDQHVEVRDCLVNALSPFPGANVLKCCVAELLVICLAFPKRVMRELEVRREPPIDQQRRADARAQCHDELNSRAAHDLEPLNVSVVGNPNRMAEARRQPRDGSTIWRPTIEKSEDNLDLDALDALTDAVRDAGEDVLRGPGGSIVPLRDELLRAGWNCHRRILVHLARRHADSSWIGPFSLTTR